MFGNIQINTFWLTTGWLRVLSGDNVGVAVGVVAVLVFDW